MAKKKVKFNTKKDFISFFSTIPAKNWCTNQWVNHAKPEQRCALGHFSRAFGPVFRRGPKKYKAMRNFRKFYHTNIDALMNVNDDGHKKFNSKKLGLDKNNIKGRVLAYLKKK